MTKRIFVCYGPSFEVRDGDNDHVAIFDCLEDAKLFVATSDLLAACEAARSWINSRPSSPEIQPENVARLNIIDMLDTAIAAARGEDTE